MNTEQERAAQVATLAAAEPLTVTRLLDLMPDSIPARHDRELIDFARAIEAAHGIGASTKEVGND